MLSKSLIQFSVDGWGYVPSLLLDLKPNVVEAMQRWQPTRLPRPWDSPGKNTGVGCHFLSNA